MPLTPNMGLDLPIPSSTLGPDWANKIIEALNKIDAHSHATGNGTKVTPVAFNITQDLPFKGKSATDVRLVRFQDAGQVPTDTLDVGCLVMVNGDLWYRNAAGTAVQLTAGGGLSFASLGTIGGDYGQSGVLATITYSELTKTYSFLQDSGKTAKLYAAELNYADPETGSLSVRQRARPDTTSYEMIFPQANPTADSVQTYDAAGQATFRQILGTPGEVTVTPTPSAHTVSLPSVISKNIEHSGLNTFTGPTLGRGIVPLGAVLATFPHLAGAYACIAVSAADGNGFVQCNGQTLSDVTSPMNGAVIPNINDSAFLMGNLTSGTTGGANSKTLSVSEMPSHTHDMSHGHGNSFGLTGTTSFASASHSHNFVHSHQWAYQKYDGFNPALWYLQLPNANTGTFIESHASAARVAGNIDIDASGTGVFAMTHWQPSSTFPLFTAGPINDSQNHVSNTAGPSASASVGFGGSVNSHSGSTGSQGSGTSFDIRPKYIQARYVMRVK